MALYEKHFVVIEYIPGGQGIGNSLVDKYEFTDEEAARSFMEMKENEAEKNKSWLCYRLSERFVPHC